MKIIYLWVGRVLKITQLEVPMIVVFNVPFSKEIVTAFINIDSYQNPI